MTKAPAKKRTAKTKPTSRGSKTRPTRETSAQKKKSTSAKAGTTTTKKPKAASPKSPKNEPDKTKPRASARTTNPRVGRAVKPKTSAAKAATSAPSEQAPQNLFSGPLTDMVLSALPHPVFVLGRDQQFQYVSTAAESFFETSGRILKRMTLNAIVEPTSPLSTLVEQVRANTATVNEYAVEITTKRFSTPKLVDLYAGPIAEQPELTVVILLQRNMAQMIERQFTHRAAARSVSGMASVLAHEIKNPLSGIRGAAQLLEPDLSDDNRSLTQLICAETDRISKIVDRMEVFGDERPIKQLPVNIHDILGHVCTLAMAGFARDIPVIEDYDPSLPAVPGDRDQLIQAFLNLIKNAAEALNANGTNAKIAIRTAFRPGVRLMVPGTSRRVSLPLMIQIEDNGIGIPDHLKPHLFDPFVTTKTNGTGLGLALVAKIIGDHGGIIEHEAEPNKTIFRVLLPMHTTVRTSAANKPIHAS